MDAPEPVLGPALPGDTETEAVRPPLTDDEVAALVAYAARHTDLCQSGDRATPPGRYAELFTPRQLNRLRYRRWLAQRPPDETTPDTRDNQEMSA